MKKILLATSALVFSAGIAAAEVTLSGDGRMGLNYGTSVMPQVWDMNGRVRVNFTLSRQGDHGLSFGGTLRIGQSWLNGVSTGIGPQNGSVFLSASGLTLTYGDIDGAVANNLPLYGGALGFTGGVGRPATHTAYAEGDSGATASVRAEYSASGFTVAVSTIPFTPNSSEIAASYKIADFTVAAGYHELGEYSLAGTYSMDALGVGVLYTRTAAGADNIRAWGTYDMGDIRIGATIGRVNVNGIDETAYGVGARYALGGGAFVHAAAGRQVNTVNVMQTTAQVGVTFAF